MNTHTYEIVDASLRHPGVITDVWGPGWAGYNKSVPLSENVRRRAWRVAQMEESKEAYEARRKARFDGQMKVFMRRLKGDWDFANVQSVPVSEEEEGEAEQWAAPEWEGDDGACHPTVQFDVVWTIS